jgi:hypothetical protein
MGRADLIGNGRQHLIPSWQPATDAGYRGARRKNSTLPGARTKATALKSAAARPRPGRILTQHTGLPPRETGSADAAATPAVARRRRVRDGPAGGGS